MSSQLTPTLYLRLLKRVVLPKEKPIMLGQVAQIFLGDTGEERRLQQLVLYNPTERDGNIKMLDMLLIIKKIKQLMPNITIETFGEPQVLIELTKRSRSPSFILFAAVCILLFVGSGLAIMNFHADVDMMEVHQKLYMLITGQKQEHPLLLQIPYSFGLGAGMMIFFNRMFKKKFNEEPNPLEVEMFKYQESLNQYVVSEEYSNKQKSSDSP